MNSSSLTSLNDDSLLAIARFVDTRSLSNFRVVSPALKLLADDDSSFSALVRRDFFTYRPQRRPPSWRARYFTLLRDHKKRLEIEGTLYSQEKEEDQLAILRERAVCLLDIIHVRLLGPFIGLSILTEVVLLSLYIDGDLDSWPFVAIMAPVWVIVLFVLLAFKTAAATRSGDMQLVLDGDSSDLIVVNAEKAVSGNSLLRAVAWLLLSLITCFIGLVCFNVSSPDEKRVPWTTVFVPLWIAGLLLCCAPCAKKRRCECGPAAFFSFLCLMLPATVSLALAVANLSGQHIRTELVLIPFWVLNGIIICVPSAALFISFKKARAGGLGYQDRSNGSVADAAAVLASTLCCLAPWLVFEILVCVFVEAPQHGGISAKGMLAPLVVWFSAVSVMLIAFSAGRRPLRPRSHQLLNDEYAGF